MGEGGTERDYYELLGAQGGETREEIVRRYRRLAAERHPDRGGSEEGMKELNEAYRVLGDNTAREAYDERRRLASSPAPRGTDNREEFVPASSPAARADALWGRAAGAALLVFLGLVLLFLVRIHYVVFLFPLALLAAALVFFGVWMAHAALAHARSGFQASHFARRSAWAQELIFLAAIAGGAYGVYLLLTSI
ncbi:MAG: J domain-containing protein [Pyrinomonadaceae bacterium]